MTNVKLEITCEVDGKRYRFVETSYDKHNEIGNCERRCALWYKKGICPTIITPWTIFPICNGVNYGHWEEIKNEKAN